MRWRPRERCGNRYAVERSRRWKSRADVGGAKDLFDRPARDPIPSCLKFPPWGGHAVETRAEPRLWVRAVWQNFSIGGGGQVLTVREQGSNRDAMAAPRAAWESVRSRTLATLEEQSRCRGGPKICSTAPPETPSPRASNFPRGVARPGSTLSHDFTI